MKTVLIVDSDKNILDIISHEILQEINVKILKATNFKDALKYILKEDLIHIAILDINLPDAKDGNIIDYAIRKEIPSIALTSIVDNKFKKLILTKDILDYVVKDSPKNIKNIGHLISRGLKNYETNVLIVEDSAIQRTLAVNQLKKMKLNVTSATNGKEALDIINKGDTNYSLVLTDYNMPIMNGMDLTFKLREQYEKDELAIVVISANSTPEVSTNFIKIGANDFINKPYTYVEFKTRINSNLELIDLFKNRSLKEQEIYEQDKKAQMAEMIGDISHQWRQPLASIAISADSIKLNHELGILDDQEMIDSLDRIEKSTQFLSKTLDNFKRFIEDEGKYQNINLQDSIENALNMIAMVFDEGNIDLKKNINYDDELMVNVIPLDLAQVIMNILNNANDILGEKNIENKWIEVSVFKKSNNAIITIEDNGGGIDKNIISKVFNPYFTTKHQSAGTGLGLHIANKIIADNFNGKLSVENSISGAKFTITLPLS